MASCAFAKLQKLAQDHPTAEAVGAALTLISAPAVARGVKLTATFLSSLSTSKKHGRIDGYNALQEGDDAAERNDQYATLVDS